MFAGIILSAFLVTVIATGNSYSKSTVINEVGGEGNVHTRIEVEANGEKKVLESTGAGRYELEVKSTNSDSSSVSVKSEVSATAKSSGKALVLDENTSIGSRIKDFVDNILKMVLETFRFGIDKLN